MRPVIRSPVARAPRRIGWHRPRFSRQRVFGPEDPAPTAGYAMDRVEIPRRSRDCDSWPSSAPPDFYDADPPRRAYHASHDRHLADGNPLPGISHIVCKSAAR